MNSFIVHTEVAGGTFSRTPVSFELLANEQALDLSSPVLQQGSHDCLGSGRRRKEPVGRGFTVSLRLFCEGQECNSLSVIADKKANGGS